MTGVDFAIGSVIALLMIAGFSRASSGRSLLVTFVPGVAVSWLVLSWMYLRHATLPSSQTFVPWFFSALTVQFLHFAEEFVTDFRSFFPRLYGGDPYSERTFVVFNMVSYALFSSCCLLVFYLDARYLLVPVLFFVVYGAIGNAISHTLWSLTARAYRPGLVTAQSYWVVGPVALYKLIDDVGATVVTSVIVVLALAVTVTAFTTRGAVRS